MAAAAVPVAVRAAVPDADGPPAAGTIDRLAAWLLGAVALDLVLTRFVVRLAIFIPKDEPFATAAAVLGRVGAAADALVPVTGILLLLALLAASGRDGGRGEQALLLAVSVVAAGGLALVVLPSTPSLMLGLALLVAVSAAWGGIRVAVVGGSSPLAARLGVALLAASIAVAAATEALATVAGLAPAGPGSPAHLGPALGVVGELLFLGGAAILGASGIVLGARARRTRRTALVAGAALGLGLLAAGTLAPLMTGTLLIWSTGLSAAMPIAMVAAAAALALAGLPALHRASPGIAIGAGVVLLAGYSLAASGLVLAGLLGLAVAGHGNPSPAAAGHGEASPAEAAGRGNASPGDVAVRG